MVLCSGYTSPEYAMYGVLSVKSNVFSFGVLILKIISGNKICEIFSMQPSSNLLRYVRIYLSHLYFRLVPCMILKYKLTNVFQAWTLWNDGKAIKLLDT